MDINNIIDLDRQASETVRDLQKKRYLWESLETSGGRPFTALLGPRGTGKTVLLRQLRNNFENSLYISADTLSSDTALKEVIRYFHDHLGVRNFFIDEIHFLQSYASDLKEIYDFTSVSLWFTSSVVLSLYKSAWDLSRRVSVFYLNPFSFREYLYFHFNDPVPSLSLYSALFEQPGTDHLRAGGRFKDYLSGGLYPFFLEPGAAVKQFGYILDTILKKDIPHFEKQITAEELLQIEKTVTFIGSSPIDGINYSSISGNVGITKYRAEKFLSLLESCFIIRRIFPRGTNVLKEPKVVMELPYRLLFKSYMDCIGELREDFFSLAMRQHDTDFFYVKTTRGQKTPDFIIDLKGSRIVVEIGGSGKGRTQFKGVEYDTKIVLYQDTKTGSSAPPQPGTRVPLHYLGFTP